MIFNPPITANLDGLFSCRLYEDTRPHCLEIAQLQKGLVLLIDGKEIIEEGVGFGTPVVLYEDRPYFSSSAQIQLQANGDRSVLTKSFSMDTVSRKRFRKAFYLNDSFYIFFHRRFHNVYTRRGKVTPILTKIIELRKALRINTEFHKVKPRGTITVKYTCSPGTIEVEVQLSRLDRARCKEIQILNEQGASFFRKYSDSDGLTLVDGQIGAWETVEADEVSLSNLKETIAFTMRNKAEATLLRGREVVPKRYSWVGFCYSLNPRTQRFKYAIKLTAPVRQHEKATRLRPDYQRERIRLRTARSENQSTYSG